MVDNSLSPHGGVLVERVAPLSASDLDSVAHLPRIAVRDQIARECVNIAYGFFSPLDGFMGSADLDSVARHMTLASGYIWSIPVVLDLSDAEVAGLGLNINDTVLLTYQGQPLATLDVAEIFSYDKEFLAQQVYGTTDDSHPGVQRTYEYQDT
ncbi:MAG: sulfate adenylyltransferase, partial [Chloroflexi bacterium]|nr:sulfate adenylyltransferase [Chloroflexota bacterium]